jgi:hypothetical protein
MMHLFRATDPQETVRTPMLAVWRGLLFVAAGAYLRRGAGLFSSLLGRAIVMRILLLVGILVQLLLLWLVGQMVDLCIDLADLWLALAKKHLEITL